MLICASCLHFVKLFGTDKLLFGLLFFFVSLQHSDFFLVYLNKYVFCRVVLSTSGQWGAIITKLSVPADWKGCSCGLTKRYFFAFNNSWLSDWFFMQSGRYIWFFWVSSWFLWLFLTYFMRFPIHFGTSLFNVRNHHQTETLSVNLRIQMIKVRGDAK